MDGTVNEAFLSQNKAENILFTLLFFNKITVTL